MSAEKIVQSRPVRLLAEARQGNADSLGVLLELYRNYLRLLARTQIDLQLQGRLNPSDVVQETFLRAYRRFGQFRGHQEQELLAWLRRILVRVLARAVENNLIAQKRDARRELSLHTLQRRLDRSSLHFDNVLVSQVSSPSDHAQQRELVAVVADRLAALPAAYRDVIVLRNLEGLSFDEVACRMNRTPGAVRVLWFRAIERFRGFADLEGLA
jgi:RNA polymerase sigma-70 factor, ECF subfamily